MFVPASTSLLTPSASVARKYFSAVPTSAFAVEIVAVSTLPAADIFEELNYEGFLHMVLSLTGQRRAVANRGPLVEKASDNDFSQLPMEVCVSRICSIMSVTPQARCVGGHREPTIFLERVAIVVCV